MVKRLLWLVVLLLIPLVLAQENVPQTDCLYYFQGEGECLDCVPVTAYLSQLQTQYPQLNVQKFDVYYNKGNLELLQKYFESYGVPPENQKIPALFLPGSYFVGQASIIALLEGRIKDNDDPNCPFLGPVSTVGIVGEASPKDVLQTLTLALITSSAIRNAFSVAIGALFLLLLMTLTSIREKEQVLTKGLAFVLAAFVSYLLFGLGFFPNLLSVSGSQVFLNLIGILSLLVAAFWILSFFGLLKPFRKMLESGDKKKKQWRIPVWLLAVIGFIAPLLTLALLEGKLLVLRNLFSGGIQRGAVVPLLLYYIAITVLPLLVTVLVLSPLRFQLDQWGEKKGFRSAQDKERFQKHYVKLFNVLVSIILVIGGMMLLS